MIGTQLSGRYRLDRKIGAGGMSTVYLAFDETLERWVAIKLMHRDISSDPDQLERFRREARAVAGLSDPGIVTVIDAGEDDGRPYIVFEYVEGETLKERIQRVGPLPIGEAVAYATEIGRALAAAHAQRLVHRDVKPQNVLIDSDGGAKVTDFGIARSLEAHGLTATGKVLGTTDYVSPEQALGEEVDEQSDIYSLGICLYEMLVGETPFGAESQVAVAMKHVREPMPNVQHRRPEVSANLAAIVERATTKEREYRYRSVAEMVHDLEEGLAIEAARAGQTTGEATTILQKLSGDTAEFAPARLRHPRRALWSSIAVLAVTGGVVAFLVTRTEPGPPAGATPRPSAKRVALKSSSAHDYDPESSDKHESPDATQFAIDGNPTTNWDTERYTDGFAGVNKSGVGLYLDAGSPVAARRLDLVTATPGFTAEVYGADAVPETLAGWTRVSGPRKIGETQKIPLRTFGRRFRNYLLWITALPSENKVEIQELSLFR